MRQGLALGKGKDEANDNLYQVLQLLAHNGVIEAEVCLNQRVHLSHDVVNELCSIVGEIVLLRVLHEFNTSQGICKYAILRCIGLLWYTPSTFNRPVSRPVAIL